MTNTKTITVPHLSGISAGYQLPHAYDASKPTLILVNSFTTSSELYTSQFQNASLTESMNLLAIELLGHGETRCKIENWTYWDTAIMNLQVMQALGIEKAFVVGTSQGGWICVRMALLASDMIQGIIPLGTSMDFESPRAHALGCWDGVAACTPSINAWTTASPTPDFEPDDAFCDFLCDSGFGENCSKETREKWYGIVKRNYRGDEGRKRARMCAVNLRDRDGMHGRLVDVRCPVLWMHGTADVVYSVANAREEIEMFVNAPSKELRVVEGGAHFLSASNPDEVDSAVLEFVKKWC